MVGQLSTKRVLIVERNPQLTLYKPVSVTDIALEIFFNILYIAPFKTTEQFKSFLGINHLK